MLWDIVTPWCITVRCNAAFPLPLSSGILPHSQVQLWVCGRYGGRGQQGGGQECRLLQRPALFRPMHPAQCKGLPWRLGLPLSCARHRGPPHTVSLPQRGAHRPAEAPAPSPHLWRCLSLREGLFTAWRSGSRVCPLWGVWGPSCENVSRLVPDLFCARKLAVNRQWIPLCAGHQCTHDRRGPRVNPDKGGSSSRSVVTQLCPWSFHKHY